MEQVLVRARTVATSAVTWLVAVSFAVAAAIPELTGVLGADHLVVVGAGRVLVVLGAVIGIVRRVSPVPRELRGLVPVPGAGDPTLVAVVPNQGFRHGGKRFEVGEVYLVDPVDAGYFVGVGWASRLHSSVEVDDVVVTSFTEEG